jgi:hypothetical protein
VHPIAAACSVSGNTETLHFRVTGDTEIIHLDANFLVGNVRNNGVVMLNFLNRNIVANGVFIEDSCTFSQETPEFPWSAI